MAIEAKVTAAITHVAEIERLNISTPCERSLNPPQPLELTRSTARSGWIYNPARIQRDQALYQTTGAPPPLTSS